MNVTCPSCATRYSVADNLLTAAGRMMRCAQCAFTWWHHPHSAPTPQHVQAQAIAQQTAVSQQAPQPAPQPVAMPEPEEVEEEEEYEEEEPEEVEEEELEEAEETESEEPELSDEEIEEAFGNEEPDPIESMTDAPPEDRADADDESEIDPDKIPDPEPLPESLTNPDDDEFEDDDEEEEEGGSRIGLVIAMVAAGLLLVLVAVFFLMSKQIASWIPATASIYESIGLNKKVLGEGLEFKNIKWSRVSLKDSEGLAVNAVIRNITKEKQPVPYIRVILLNNEDKSVQEQVVKPRKPTIEPGKSLGFKYQFDEPAATARRGILGFTEAPAPAKKDSADKPEEKPKAEAEKK